MKTKSYIVLILMFLSLNVFSQKIDADEIKTDKAENNFETFDPNESDRPDQFLTNYLRTHRRFNLDPIIKKLLVNPIRTDDASNSMRGNMNSGITSITRIFLDNQEILGEGINRLYVIQNTTIEEIDKITRSKVGYDAQIHIYSKK
jgi:hypothetical protein